MNPAGVVIFMNRSVRVWCYRTTDVSVPIWISFLYYSILLGLDTVSNSFMRYLFRTDHGQDALRNSIKTQDRLVIFKITFLQNVLRVLVYTNGII